MESQNPDTERAIKEHNAEDELRKLITAGCEKRMLINALSLMRDQDDSWEGLVGQAWPGFRGDLRRKVESSIRQIRDCAAEIRRLERTTLWAQMLYTRSQYSPGVQFDPFSKTLESYANTWSEVVSNTGPKKHPYLAEVKAGLVAYVKESTGDWHDEELSALIAAGTGKPCDAHALREWRKENKELIDYQQSELRHTNRSKPA